MKHFNLILVFLSFYTLSRGQDGSDIRYLSPLALDSSFIGKEVHLDFYQRSFDGIHPDTITLKIDGTPIRFLEKRIDDGHNNWFVQQSLEAIDTLNSIKITISYWTILKVSADSILVKPNYHLRFPKETFIDHKLFKETFWFTKAIIKEVLVKSKPFGT